MANTSNKPSISERIQARQERRLQTQQRKLSLKETKLKLRQKEIEQAKQARELRGERWRGSSEQLARGSALVGRGVRGTRDAIGGYMDRQWHLDFDGGILESHGVDRLEHLTDMRHRERLSDFSRRLRGAFSISTPEPSIREQKYEAFNRGLVETHIALSEIPTSQLADLVTALQGKRGGINEEEASEVLAVWLHHKTRADDSDSMATELMDQQSHLMGELATEYVEHFDQSQTSLDDERWNARRSLSTAKTVEQDLQGHISRYTRAAQLQDSFFGRVGGGIRAGLARGSMNRRAAIAAINPWGDPTEITNEMYDETLSPNEAIQQERTNIIDLLDGAYDEISGNSDVVRIQRLDSIGQQLELNSQSNNYTGFITEALEIHEIEGARLQQLQERYGEMDQIINYYEGSQNIPSHIQNVINEMNEISNNLGNIEQLARYYNETRIQQGQTPSPAALTTLPPELQPVASGILDAYGTSSGNRNENLQNIFQSEREYKTTHNNELAHHIQNLRQNIDLPNQQFLSAQRTQELFNEIQQSIRTQERSFNTQHVPVTMKRIESLRDKIQKTGDRAVHYQRESDELRGANSPLAYYENLLRQISEDDDIIQKMENEQFMIRESKFMREELHRQRAISALEQETGVDENEKLSLLGALDEIGEAFEAVEFDPDDPEDVRKWLNTSLATLGGYGLGSPESLNDDQLMGFASQAKKDNLTFMQMFILLFQSLFSAKPTRNSSQ